MSHCTLVIHLDHDDDDDHDNDRVARGDVHQTIARPLLARLMFALKKKNDDDDDDDIRKLVNLISTSSSL